MNAGGAETFLMKVYRALDKTKYQMDFAVAVKDEGYYDKEILANGGKIYRITPKSDGAFKNFNEIKRLVKENGYNYVLRTSQHSLSAMELLAAKKGGAKVRVFRSSNSDTVSQSKKQRLLHKLFSFMPKRYANVKIAPSTEAANFMFGKKSVERGDVFLLKNAVDLEYFKFCRIGRDEIRKQFGVEDDCVLVGHIGRFSTQKNHSYLLEIFKKIHSLNQKTKLMLVGKGELEQKIKAKVSDLGLSDSVIFTGVRSDIPSILSAMDVFLFPSLYEGMPNTVIEAQATGLPCVISDTITGEADITGLVKYLSLHDTVDSWAKETLCVACNDDRLSVKEKFIEMHYDIESTVKDFVKLVFNEEKE